MIAVVPATIPGPWRCVRVAPAFGVALALAALLAAPAWAASVGPSARAAGTVAPTQLVATLRAGQAI
jgi:hypothetical protein